MTDALAIDRLILEVPGLDAERAATLAERIGLALAGGLAVLPADVDRLAVQLDAIEDEPDALLAGRIAAALLRRIG